MTVRVLILRYSHYQLYILYRWMLEMLWGDCKLSIMMNFWGVESAYVYSSGLPLEKARWLPRHLPLSAPPEKRQLTPPVSLLQTKPAEPLSAAWDPSSLLPKIG